MMMVKPGKKTDSVQEEKRRSDGRIGFGDLQNPVCYKVLISVRRAGRAIPAMPRRVPRVMSHQSK